MDFVRTIADGDYVLMHNRGTNSPGTKAVVDIFRIEDGKVVEHWELPKFRVEIKRVFVQGDMVAVHVRSFDWKGARSLNTGTSFSQLRIPSRTPTPCFDREGCHALHPHRGRP